MTRFGICLTGVMMLAATAAAQDSNYWNNQYGTKAELLGGLVVGSASDISAAYYNPAWLAVGTDASLLLTTRALEYATLEIKNAVGSGENPKHTSFRPSPGFLGGQFGKGGTWNVTWVYVEKMNFKFDGSARLVDEDPTPPPGGNFWYSGEAFRVTDAHETWYGAAFSRMIGENTSFGVTPFVAYRSQNQRIQAMVQALDASNTYADYYLVNEMGYSHFRALAKLGVAFDYRPVSFGLALTTPSLGITGSGNVYANNSYSGIDVDGDGVPDPYLAVTNQEGLAARWKSPLALAVGASWYLGDTRLHATAEWFDAVKGYDAISSEPFRSQETGETLYPNHRAQSRSLVNYGVAADHRFTDVVSAFAGFRSDFTTEPERKPSNLLMSSWDLWHLSGGASFQFLGIELTMGLEYTFGDGTSYQVVDFSGGQGPDPAGDELATDVQYNRLKLLVGLDLAVLVGGS